MIREFIWCAPARSGVSTNAVSTDQENLPEAKVELQLIAEQTSGTNMTPRTQFL